MQETKNEQPSVFEGRKYVYEVGRRKTAVATIRLYDKGNNTIMVNGKKLEEYYPNTTLQGIVKDPFVRTGCDGQFDVSIHVKGGGQASQAESIRHGVSRALSAFDKDKRAILKKLGFLTRDPREKERKKPGLRRARRAPQWSKR